MLLPNPLSDKYPSLSPYAYCANNPVILVDPDGRYGIPVDKLEEYRRDYPMIMKYLEHHVENDVMGSPTILQGFMESSANNFTSDKVREAVHFGTGPTLIFVEAPNGEEDATGYYDAPMNRIEINTKEVFRVNQILKSNSSQEEKLMALLDFYQTLLHETAEYGNTNQNSPLVQKEDYNDDIEPGHYFEAGVWGGNPDCYIPGYHKMKDAAKCVIEQQRANGKTDTLPTIPIIE